MNGVDPAVAAIAAIFFDECALALDTARAGLRAIERGEAAADTRRGMARAIHSIKGGAGVMGFPPLFRFAHQVETVLSAMARASDEAPAPLPTPAPGATIDAAAHAVLRDALDTVAAHVEAAARGDAPPDDRAVAAALDRLCGDAGDRQAVSDEADGADDIGFRPVAVDLNRLDATIADRRVPWLVRVTPASADLALSRDPMLMIRALQDLGGDRVAFRCERLPSLAAIDPAASYGSWTIRVPGTVSLDDVEACADFVADDTRVDIARDGARIAG